MVINSEPSENRLMSNTTIRKMFAKRCRFDIFVGYVWKRKFHFDALHRLLDHFEDVWSFWGDDNVCESGDVKNDNFQALLKRKKTFPQRSDLLKRSEQPRFFDRIDDVATPWFRRFHFSPSRLRAQLKRFNSRHSPNLQNLPNPVTPFVELTLLAPLNLQMDSFAF